MISTELTESVARPASVVFDFIADVRNDPRWHTDVLKARLVEGTTVAKNSTFEIETKPVMGISGGTVRVAEYDPPSRIVFEVRMGKLRPTTIFTVTPNHAGSLVTRKIEMEPEGLMRFIAPFMGGMLRNSNAAFLANLRRVLEGEAGNL
jgi:uncharacterized protein YndB with AHSA1/START domain